MTESCKLPQFRQIKKKENGHFPMPYYVTPLFKKELSPSIIK